MTDTQGPASEAGFVQLHMPPDPSSVQLINLDFGPAGRHDADHDERNITFRGEREGGGYAMVRGDHPLLARLLEKYPQVRYVTKEGKEPIYVCDDCGDEFGSKPALRTHRRSHKPEPEA
jgi:hypothetical protein